MPNIFFSYSASLATTLNLRNINTKFTGKFSGRGASPELRRSLGNLGAEPLGGSAADATAFVSAEYKKWGTVVKAAKIKID